MSYAYALIEYAPKLEDGSTLFNHLAQRSVPLVGKFKPQELANTVGLRKQGYHILFFSRKLQIISLDSRT